MPRSRNTDVNGGPFSAQTVQAVWNKGTPISGYDSGEWRRDPCRRAIQRSKRGDTTSEYG